MYKTIDALDVAGKTVLVRVDFNVPMADGSVTDDTRIRRASQTLEELAARGAKVVAVSHFGRPKGRVEPSMSLGPLVGALQKALPERNVTFSDAAIGDGNSVSLAVADLQQGAVMLLENLRFYSGEEKPHEDPAFGEALTKLGDVYVNDAFSCCHRAHASMVMPPRHLPSAVGRLLQTELEALEGALTTPQRPVAAVVGGAKVSTKLNVLTHLIERVDVLIIGGGMANTFLFASGLSVGKSLCEKDMADTAREVLDRAKSIGCRIVLPVDGRVATEFAEGADFEICPVTDISDNGMILDVGPESEKSASDALEGCKTLVWNGPMGAFEIPPFDTGTNVLAQKAAELTESGQLVSVAGGGDTVAALVHAGAEDSFSYISTAGGAFLEWMEGKDLPGIKALETH